MSAERPFGEFIEVFETSNLPGEQLAGRAMREIFLSGEYITSDLIGPTNNLDESFVIGALQMAVVIEGMLFSANMHISRLPDAEELLDSNTSMLPFDTSDFAQYEGEAASAVFDQGLSTVAALVWGLGEESGEIRLKICCPRVYTELPSAPEDDRGEFARGIAGHFIQKALSSKRAKPNAKE